MLSLNYMDPYYRHQSMGVVGWNCMVKRVLLVSVAKLHTLNRDIEQTGLVIELHTYICITGMRIACIM